MYHLGIDLGGTNIAAGVVADSGFLHSRVSCPTPRGASCEALAHACAQAARLAADAAGIPLPEIADCGLGTPGAVTPDGTVAYCSTFQLHNAPLGAVLEQVLGLPVAVENDANAAACGEAVCGAGRGVQSMIAVTYGTGVGGGIILNGKLLTGCNGAAGELGHIVLRQNGKPCACGRRGCYERYASATALIEMTREAMETQPESALWRFAPTIDQVNGRTVFDAAKAGDETACAVRAEYLDNVACGLIDLVQLFQPELIVLGGGISGQGEVLLAPIRAALDREDYARGHAVRTRVAIAELGNDAGMIGAALIRRFHG